MNYCYEYPRPAVSVDVVILAETRAPKILLIKRLKEPYADCWALPGGFLDIEETLEESAVREVKEETGLEISDLVPIAPFSSVDRDPRFRVISFAFLARLESVSRPQAGDDAKAAQWFELDALPRLAFDHAEMVERARRSWLQPGN
jgi:8-oxo-dGTP diphosphatase